MEEAQFITDNDALRAACYEWQQSPFLAIDTEFIRVTTFYPKPGLIQVGVAEKIYLVDPLAITDMRPFSEILQNPRVLKVLHACLEDIDLFKQSFNAIPAPIFDTQIAAAIAGLGFSMGYQKLVEQLLGVSLEKGETRSDWLQRPLTNAQCHYAAQDVKYLPALYQKLAKMLREQHRLPWVEEECEYLLNEAQCWDDVEHHYLRIKSAWKLNRRGLVVLKRLYIWRDQEARKRDVPRNYVLKESALWPLSHFQPKTLEYLSKIEGMHPKIIQQHGEKILDLIAQAQQIPEELCPPLLPKPFSEKINRMMKQIKALVDSKASELGVAPEILMSRKHITALLLTHAQTGEYRLPPALFGWRSAVIGQPLLDLLAHIEE